jgi:hypothetical protein
MRKKTDNPKKNTIRFERCSAIDIIYDITEFKSKNENFNNSKFWIAYFETDDGYMNYEIYSDSCLLHADNSYDYIADSDSVDIFDDSLNLLSDLIGEIINFDCITEIKRFLTSINIIVEYGIKKPKVINESSLGVVNTKIFTFSELKSKRYGDLMVFFDGLLEVAEDIEYSIEDILELEKENELTKELEKELNFLTTQLDYMFKNIQTCNDVIKFLEDKVKFAFNEFTIFIN